jgi:hypothetical protein
MNLTKKLRTSLSKTLLTATIVGSFFTVSAKEGMWLPPTLKNREADMKAMGLRIPIEQLYNANGTGLNNAVVLFGGGCTGEIISSKGLLLTNHHCGYSSAQKLSSTTNDYFANGFWAKNMDEELPCAGLTVTFIRKMENVTDKILYNLADTLAEATRDSVIATRIKALEKGYKYLTKMDATIQPYFRGNQYWAIVSETYRDVRFVGFPPNGIGNFGGDTDNWMWPRHNADFSLFRVYADAQGKPAAYSKDNKPYNPKVFMKINVSGYKEGDFTMVYGFPGTTQEYIASAQLKQISTISDPIRIEVRTQKLAVWKAAMAANRDVFIKYTSKRAGIANGWKKWQGEVRGLNINKVEDIKQQREQTFQEWATRDTAADYADDVLAQIQATVNISNNALRAEEYIREAVLGIELIAQGGELEALLKLVRAGNTSSDKVYQDAIARWKAFYKNYDAATDRQLFATLMPLFIEKCPDYVPAEFKAMLARNGNDYEKWARNVYNSPVASEAWLNEPIDANTILAMPAYQLYRAIIETRNNKVLPVLRNYTARMTRLNRLYMAAQMKARDENSMYPDANLTLRVTYGKVKGIDPEGPAGYSFQTNIDEAIAKDQPDVEEFRVPLLLKDLHANKNYGRWGVKGTVPLAFIADNHTSGGNSGSPVLNAKGELIGTNFDRIWEGTMSDLYFDPNLCRNISVDIRYTLFIIEKFGGAGWLLKEMQLVKN